MKRSNEYNQGGSPELNFELLFRFLRHISGLESTTEPWISSFGLGRNPRRLPAFGLRVRPPHGARFLDRARNAEQEG
jgi:hypothetical protein